MADFEEAVDLATAEFESLPPQQPLGRVSGARVTHASAVRMAIENDIFSGRLMPGAEIDEDELAERFSISRTPIREAMLQLLQTGLIEKKPRRPATVAVMELPRLIHMFETVSELEALCARFAATRSTTREKDELVLIHDKSARALEAGDFSNYPRLGRQFHILVMEATHNKVLIETTDKLALHTLPYRRFQLRHAGHSEANQVAHDRILEAILRGDGQSAAEAMRGHVIVQGDVLAEYISMG